MTEPWLLKRPASIKAVNTYVRNGMTIGLGTGNAANMAIDRIAELVSDGMGLKFVASSVQTEVYARSKGLNVEPYGSVKHIDVTIDGADEIGKDLVLIKGLGGALLREKRIAEMTDCEIIVADGFKKVDVLGINTPLPVEVEVNHVGKITKELSKLGCIPTLRVRDGKTFISDNGNNIMDCKFERINSPKELDARIKSIDGVVETGLFIGLAHSAFLYNDDGTVTEFKG